MWVLIIHRSLYPSPVLLVVAISGSMCAQPTMFPTVKTCQVIVAGAFLGYTNFKTGSKLPEFSAIVVCDRANWNSTKAPSSCRSSTLKSHCSCRGRHPYSAPSHLPRLCFTHTQWSCRSPPRQLCLPLNRHISDIRWPSKPSTSTIIPWLIESSIACSGSSDIYIMLRRLCLIHSQVLLYIAR